MPDDFDLELEQLTSAVSRDEESRSLRKRFEQSAEWLRHKRYHEEEGGTPVLRIWDEVREEPKQAVEEAFESHHDRKTIKVGGCDCQPRLPFMELSDRGDVIAGIPVPETVSSSYNATPGTTTTYGAAGGPVENVYNAGPGNQKELYR
jgi:hypothetical protein